MFKGELADQPGAFRNELNHPLVPYIDPQNTCLFPTTPTMFPKRTLNSAPSGRHQHLSALGERLGYRCFVTQSKGPPFWDLFPPQPLLFGQYLGFWNRKKQLLGSAGWLNHFSALTQSTKGDGLFEREDRRVLKEGLEGSQKETSQCLRHMAPVSNPLVFWEDSDRVELAAEQSD